MKFIVIISMFLALSAGTSIKEEEENKPVPIVKQEYDSGFDGTFKNSFETANGIAFEQTGNVKTVQVDEDDKVVQEIVGSYSYTAPDGTPVKVDYVANEGGFQPIGAILPTPPPNPPLPAAIARAIKFIEEHQPKEE